MSARELYRAAEKLKAEGALPEAVEKYAEVLAIDPTFVMAHHALAVVCTTLGDHDRAISHALQAVELEPNDPFAYMSLSVTYRRAFEGTGNQRFIQLAEDAMARSNAFRGSCGH